MATKAQKKYKLDQQNKAALKRKDKALKKVGSAEEQLLVKIFGKYDDKKGEWVC